MGFVKDLKGIYLVEFGTTLARNQILKWSYFHCPGTTLAFLLQKAQGIRAPPF